MKINHYVGFSIRFLAIFLVLDLSYLFFVETEIGKRFLSLCVAQPGALLINAISHADHVIVMGSVLTSGAFDLNITKGCDGMEAVTLLCAAILAARGSIKSTALGLLLGSSLILLVNTFRIAGLYFVRARAPDLFESMHSFAGPLIIVAIGMLFFWIWMNRVETN